MRMSLDRLAERAGRWEVVLVIGFFLVATAALYVEIVLPTRIMADYDVWAYFYPLRTYAAYAIQSGRFPLWNPDTFLGAPFFANPQTALLYPGTALFYVLPVPYAYSLSILLHVLLAGCFMYALMRRSFGLGYVAALVGAVTFAFSGFFTSQTGHLNQISATAWMPAIALAADRALMERSVRWGVLGGAALAVQLLAGHAQECYMTLWVVGLLIGWRTVERLYGATRAARHDQNEDQHVEGDTQVVPPTTTGGHARRILGIVGGAIGVALLVGALGFGVAAIQLLPTAELSEQGIRGGGLTYREGIAFSLPPQLLVRSLMPGYYYNPTDENIGYIGAIGLGLAALALLFSRRGAVIFGAVTAAVGLFLALGGANPFYSVLFEVIPGLDLFRVPARWLVVYTFGAATLAGLGAQWVFERPRAPVDVPRLVGVGAFLLALAALAIPSLTQVPGRIAALWFGGFGAAALVALLALRWPGRLLAAALLAVMLVELRFAGLDLPARTPVPEEAAETPREVPAHLMSSSRPDRILSIAPVEYEVADYLDLQARYPDLSPTASQEFRSALKLDEVMTPNVPLRYGLVTADGYDGGVLPLRRYLSIASLLVPPAELRPDGVLRTRLTAVPDRRLLSLFGIGRIIANRVQDAELDGIPYDVATARTLNPGDHLRVNLEQAASPSWIGMLASYTAAEATPGQEMGRLVLIGRNGGETRLPLLADEHIFNAASPGPLNARPPSAGAPITGRADTSVRIEVEEGPPMGAVEWQWDGPGTLQLRAATIGDGASTPEQLILQPDLHRTVFRNLKVYESATLDLGVPLVPSAEVMDDAAALGFLRGATTDDLRRMVALAPGAEVQTDTTAAVLTPVFVRDEGGGNFRDRLVYRRALGDAGGYLIVDDAWFPGWRALVDGQETTVERANVFFKAVWVPPGARTVQLSYEPRSVRLGLALSIGAVLAGIVLLIRGRVP